MNRRGTSGLAAARTLVGAVILISVATTSTIALAGTAGSGDRVFRSLRPGYAYTIQPPPPALRPYFDAFLPLYVSYNAVPASTHKPSFSQWLIMHRVVDPTTHQAMLLLYVWAERLPRPLV